MRCASHGRTDRVGPGRPADFARCVAGEFLLDPAIRARMTAEETEVLQRLRAFLLGLVNVQAAECAPTPQERDLLASLRCRFQVPKEPPLQGPCLAAVGIGARPLSGGAAGVPPVAMRDSWPAHRHAHRLAYRRQAGQAPAHRRRVLAADRRGRLTGPGARRSVQAVRPGQPVQDRAGGWDGAHRRSQ